MEGERVVPTGKMWSQGSVLVTACGQFHSPHLISRAGLDTPGLAWTVGWFQKLELMGRLGLGSVEGT